MCTSHYLQFATQSLPASPRHSLHPVLWSSTRQPSVMLSRVSIKPTAMVGSTTKSKTVKGKTVSGGKTVKGSSAPAGLTPGQECESRRRQLR